MKSYDKKTSPLKSTQWAKRGFTIPKDTDGAYRVVGRIDKKDVIGEARKNAVKLV